MANNLPTGGSVADVFDSDNDTCANCYAFTYKDATHCYVYCSAEITAVQTNDNTVADA